MAYLIPSLLCPLMMLVCMGGLRLPWKRRAGRGSAAAPPTVRDRAEEVASLRLQQAELSRRLEALATESPDQDDGVSPWRAAG
jgi:hypothetical protein